MRRADIDLRDDREGSEDFLIYFLILPSSFLLGVRWCKTASRLRAWAVRPPTSNSSFILLPLDAALGVSAFVLAATVGGLRMGLLVMIAVSAGTFACILALPAHSLPAAYINGM